MNQEPSIAQVLQIGVQHHQAGRMPEAEVAYRQVLQREPNHPDALHLLGMLAFQTGKKELALELVNQAIRIDSGKPVYYNNLGTIHASQNQLRDAIACFQKAVALKPDYTDAHTNLGIAFQNQGNLDEAATSYRAVLGLTPGSIVAHMNLGSILYRQRSLDDAAGCFRTAAKLGPQQVAAHSALGKVLSEQHKFSESIASYQRVLDLEPDHIGAIYGLAAIHYEQGKLREAADYSRRAIELKSDFAEAHNMLGNVSYGQGALDDAIARYRKAIELKPDYVEAYNNMGMALQYQDRLEEAKTFFQRALSLDPGYAEAHNNLGNARHDAGDLLGAEGCYRRALELDPQFADAWNNLGNLYRDQGKLDEAVNACRRAVALNPDFSEAHANLGNALKDQGKLDEAIACYRVALELRRVLPVAYSNLLFALQFDAGYSQFELLAAHRGYATRFEAPLQALRRPHNNTREPGRRLKIGYVSADFRNHPVADFIEPAFVHHDKSGVEVFCYYSDSRRDEVTGRIAGYSDHWIPCKGMSDDELAERIRSDGIDILVDLSGHTGGNRLLVFARKPAPVQVTYLGYPGTSGLSAMDYRLTDRYADPEGSEAYYTEKLLRLPDSLCCYRPPADMPEILPLPALKNGFVTFGSFNNFNKIDRACIELWSALLRAVPTSRLLMVTVPEGETRQRLLQQFTGFGIAPARLELRGKLPRPEFQRMFQRADIALDPFPVTGGTTTCETLWMGVPVIVLVGERYISRVGYSFLSAAGLQEFAAGTKEDYVRIAAALAGDIPRLEQLHAGMREKVAASTLVDEARFTRNLEQAYRQIWQQWCSSGS